MDKKLPRRLIGNRGRARFPDLVDFFQVFVVAVVKSGPSSWFAHTKVIVSGAVVPKSDSCEYFFYRNML